MLGVVESVMGGDQEKCGNGKVVVQIEVLAFPLILKATLVQ